MALHYNNGLCYSRFIRHDLIRLIRADEWWYYKLVPILSTFYATAVVLHVPVISLWASAVTLLLSIVLAASYASAINELADRADDAAAGKQNRAAERPRFAALVLALTLGAGLTCAWLWRDDAKLFCCYLAMWFTFALYSVPPFRFKQRGVVGVLCDALGEQMLPSLVAVLIAARGAHRATRGVWVFSVAVWALAFGLRGIIWHQFRDLENDRAAGVRTFVSRHSRMAGVIGACVVWPLELGAFTLMLWQIGGAWPAAFLLLYSFYAIRSARRGHLVPVIVTPKPRSFIAMQDFYTDLFPVAVLIAASLRDRRDLVVLVIHLIMFPRRVLYEARRVTSSVRSSISNRRVNASIANTVVKDSEPHHGGLG